MEIPDFKDGLIQVIIVLFSVLLRYSENSGSNNVNGAVCIMQLHQRWRRTRLLAITVL